MPENKHLRLLLLVLYGALAVLGLWLGFRFALPWLAPFLTAYALSALLERPVGGLVRRWGLPRWGAAALCTVVLGVLLLGLLGLGVWRLWYEGGLLLERLPALLAGLPQAGGAWQDWLYRMMTAAPASARGYLEGLVDGLSAQVSSLAGQLSTLAVQWAAAVAAALPGVFLFLFTCAVSTYFISATRPALLAFLRRQVPRDRRARVGAGLKRLRATFGQWLKAQGLLMLVTFGELTAGFLVLGVESFLLTAALTAVVDALPVFGSGTVLLPWAAVVLLGGDWKLAVGLLALYAVVSAVRSLLEPKLVGDRVGLPPLAALMSMYVGFQALGVGGMILAPILTMFLKELHDCGFLRLWRD